MEALVVAQRRYAEMRRRLDVHCETDRGLHDELTRAIRSLEQKIAARGADQCESAPETTAERDRAHEDPGQSARKRGRAGKSRPD